MGGGALLHPLPHPKLLSSLWSCCPPSGAAASQLHSGAACHMPLVTLRLTLGTRVSGRGERSRGEGRDTQRSAASAEASLTLFPAAASAISIYSPAASPPGHSAAAVAGFQGCSVIKHPCLLQLLHSTSPAATGAGSAPGSMATPKAAPRQWLEDWWGWGWFPAPAPSALSLSESFGHWKCP